MAGKLYIVGTPIGNLSDLSPRAVETLGKVDFIAAEDTRVTQKLLTHFSISKPMVSYHKFSGNKRGEDITARLLDGETCAIVTDAGMPCISDPGEELVRECHEHGVEIESVPGPSAAITALCMAMLLLIGHWYQNREAVQVGSYASVEVAQTVRVLCNQYRTFWF